MFSLYWNLANYLQTLKADLPFFEFSKEISLKQKTPQNLI